MTGCQRSIVEALALVCIDVVSKNGLAGRQASNVAAKGPIAAAQSGRDN